MGRLNWRTSYTQNQWKHAVEAGFLCSMMAEELGLDRQLARRAALMHDIGKALTHELDGSHAVIGADYARRLGETSWWPTPSAPTTPTSPSPAPTPTWWRRRTRCPARGPGARRQAEDNHMAKMADLERISRGFAGVAEAFAVQGGREVRVLVREGEVDDLRAVELSSRIARAISRRDDVPRADPGDGDPRVQGDREGRRVKFGAGGIAANCGRNGRET